MKRKRAPWPSESRPGIYPIIPNTTNASSYTITLTSGHEMTAEVEHGPLCRLQDRLWKGRFWWFGNRLSDLRYWLWRLSR